MSAKVTDINNLNVKSEKKHVPQLRNFDQR